MKSFGTGFSSRGNRKKENNVSKWHFMLRGSNCVMAVRIVAQAFSSIQKNLLHNQQWLLDGKYHHKKCRENILLYMYM